eukprot:jgi/Botrbrau1/8239/Bobra.0392s0034.1
MGNSTSAPVPGGSIGEQYRSQGQRITRNATLTFRAIADKFNSIEDVQHALRQQGLESSQLVFGIDFTKSNEWTGKYSFGNRSLHSPSGPGLNPYEDAMSTIARTLVAFDDDDEIPVYGFGDATTHNTQVFSFYPDGGVAHGLDEALRRYKEVAPHVKLAGPTSFAPIIYQALRLIAENGHYHILVIIADGQVTRGSDTRSNAWSPDEQATVDAIVAASEYPLSIILVGVGDGPWDVMKAFDDRLPARRFDNFQFVNFTGLRAETQREPQARRDALFALRALMEIPDQYQLIGRLGLFGRRPPPSVLHKGLPPLGPPPSVLAADQQGRGTPSVPPAAPYNAPTAPPVGRGGGLPLGGDPPAMFLCPITQEVMHEPVLAADGHTYERVAIEGWLSAHDTSPMTNERMPHKILTPNHNLRSAIREWQGF